MEVSQYAAPGFPSTPALSCPTPPDVSTRHPLQTLVEPCNLLLLLVLLVLLLMDSPWMRLREEWTGRRWEEEEEDSDETEALLGCGDGPLGAAA